MVGAGSSPGGAPALRVLVLHGPNLNLLGQRDASHYGRLTLAQLDALIARHAVTRGVTVRAEQRNVEGDLVELIQRARGAYDAIVMNPGGYTHTSVAIRDAIEAAGVPTVEVHLSNLHAREAFRQVSITAPRCVGQICGFGPQSYVLGLDAAIAHVEDARRAGPSSTTTASPAASAARSTRHGNASRKQRRQGPGR